MKPTPQASAPPTDSPLAAPARVPLLRPKTALPWLGRTLVVAPHPDDESLGCGGLLALLARRGQAASVLFTTDGSGSHPGSRTHPPPRLRALRETEAVRALRRLGLPAEAAAFLRLRDRFVPPPGAARFHTAAARCGRLLRRQRVQTVVLPWRRDPHGDHRATWRLLRAAASALPVPPRFVEYPVWTWEWPAPGDLPRPGEVRSWRLDIRAVLPRKKAAIAAHRSQTTGLIGDAPEAFRLTPAVLRHFHRPWELFLEGRQLEEN